MANVPLTKAGHDRSHKQPEEAKRTSSSPQPLILALQGQRRRQETQRGNKDKNARGSYDLAPMWDITNNIN